MKVLVVVEDDEEMRMIIGRCLAADERLVAEANASTAREAIEEAKRMQPDLVILDHYIEGKIMGLEAAPLLKEVAPESKILLFSGHDLTAECLLEPAIDVFLPKAKLLDLLPTCRRLLGLHAA